MPTQGVLYTYMCIYYMSASLIEERLGQLKEVLILATTLTLTITVYVIRIELLERQDPEWTRTRHFPFQALHP